jgi:LPS export ABC transporter protein LptC
MKLSKKTWIILAFTLLTVLMASALLIFDRLQKSPQSLLKVMADHVDLQVRDVVYTDVGQSGEKWEIRADTARYLKQDQVALFEKVRVKLITSEGKTFRLNGERGTLKTDTKNLEISGNVEIISDRGDRFNTDVLRYSNADSTVHTNGIVKMWSDQIQIRGTGMIMSLKQNTLSLKSNVKGQIQVR